MNTILLFLLILSFVVAAITYFLIALGLYVLFKGEEEDFLGRRPTTELVKEVLPWALMYGFIATAYIIAYFVS